MKLAIGRLFETVLGLLREDSNASSMRLLMLGSWSLVLFVWAKVSLAKSDLAALPETILLLLITSAGAKYAQKFVEVKSETPTQPK